MAMSKQAKSLVSTLVLALVGALVVWVGYFATKQKTEDRKKSEEVSAKAFDFDKTKVKSLSLTAKGATTELAKDAEGWKITAPVTARAESSAVDAIVDKLSDLKAKDLNANTKPKKAPEYVVADRSRAADFGLAAPQFRVKAVLEDGRELTLDVGEENPYDKSLPYLKSGDDRIYYAEPGLKYPLDKSLFDLRDKALVTHQDSEVQAVEVTSATGSWSAERDGDGWKLLTPIADRADKTVVEGVLARVRGARAKAFAAEATDAAALAEFGKGKPAATVTFALGADRAKKTVIFGEQDEAGTKKLFARLADGGPVLELDPAILGDLGKTAADLRDKTVAAFDREQVRTLELALAGGETVTISRTKETPPDGGYAKENFALVGREGKPKDWKASSTLYTLSTLKGMAIAAENAKDLAGFGLDKPRATWTVKGDGDKELARILLGKEHGTRVYAMKAGATRVYEVEKATADSLPATVDDLLETPPAKVEAAPGADPGSP